MRKWKRGNERPTSNVQHPISNEGHSVGRANTRPARTGDGQGEENVEM